MKHISVMLNKSIEELDISENGIYVDCTLGRGGHSLEIASKLKGGHLYCFDKDEEAINESKEVLKDYLDKITFIHKDFRNLAVELAKYEITGVDGILLDLGVSSPQFDDVKRGFSYRFDSRLDMRMDKSQKLTAYDVVNEYSYSELLRIFYSYGEEKFSKQIARKIEKQRIEKPIETTFELVDIIKSSLPMKVLSKKGHPAKQVFQAIRIEVNREMEALNEVLDQALSLLNENGRCVVITFHSLEDRIVKEKFNEVSKYEKVDKRIPVMPDQIKKPDYICINKKPIIADEDEIKNNKRSQSAKLRVIMRRKK
ncbi:MAG: 16S rRNA (cytosine(1402)-N(4))-methyltransferase RsmH [Anaerorhabdus sp.]